MHNILTSTAICEKQDSNHKPLVVAPITEDEIGYFLKEHLYSIDWPFRLQILETTYETDKLIKTLNNCKAEVMLTAWSTKRLPEDILKQVPSLKYAAHMCGTVRGFIPRSLIERGLIVTNWGNCVARTVAEHCLLQVLACLRKAAKWQLEMHTHQGWKPARYNVLTLFNKRVGIHGFGASAREFVKLIRAFGCRINVYSPHVGDKTFEEYGIERAETLEELFSGNEIIVDLAPLTPQTRSMVTEELLAMIPEDGVFVNSGRGAVVDERALARVAQKGRIQIAIDVFETEPLPKDSPLRSMDNVFLTPHIAGPTIDERKVCGLHALNNVKAYYENRPLQSVISLDAYDRMT